jgi:orotidine-5'-phosphate decarboxylase
MLSDRLIGEIIKKESPIVVGLDPRLDMIPEEITKKHFNTYGETLKAVSESIIEFNRGIIDAVTPHVPAVKPQIAFYEQYGIEGLIAYQDACKYARENGLIVVGDVKRGDIGSTSKAYSIAHLGKTIVGTQKISTFEVDFATVNPYLGDDCMQEFMEEIELYDKGIFILVKTSNKTSGQIQDLDVSGEKVYEKVARMVNHWSEKNFGNSGYSSIGAVVGATYPAELEILRKKMPRAMFLVPGYGAQGGGARDIIGAFDKDGLGALINNSRGILYAYVKEGGDYKRAAEKATIDMKLAIAKEVKNLRNHY